MNARVIECVCGLIQISALRLFQVILFHLLLILPVDEWRLPCFFIHLEKRLLGYLLGDQSLFNLVLGVFHLVSDSLRVYLLLVPLLQVGHT